jgi:hypothetical protein
MEFACIHPVSAPVRVSQLPSLNPSQPASGSSPFPEKPPISLPDQSRPGSMQRPTLHSCGYEDQASARFARRARGATLKRANSSQTKHPSDSQIAMRAWLADRKPATSTLSGNGMLDWKTSASPSPSQASVLEAACSYPARAYLHACIYLYITASMTFHDLRLAYRLKESQIA